MKRKTVYIIVAVVAALVLLTFGAGWYMLDYALKPDYNRRDTAVVYKQIAYEYPWTRPWIDSLKHARALRDTFITTPAGERHHALFVRNPRSMGRTAIVVHGYTDCSIRMLPIASIYERMGYNILVPDLHAHGLSDGDDIQMGWKDRNDIIRWIYVARRMFRDADRSPRIVLHGVSMGAAMVMNVSGEKLPDGVCCFVEDCGFTSAWDEFSHQLGEQFGLPDFPVLYAASMLCKLRYGWTFGEASSLKQLGKRHTPMLYIHGTSDNYVPSAMVLPLFNMNPAYENKADKTLRYNDIWLTPGCAHAKSYHDYPYEYERKVKKFVAKHIGRL